jgi:uncharacterized protein YndB with AHSA1/START domain
MKDQANTIEVKVQRTIPAPVEEVFDGWLDPKLPGTPWSMADKLLFHPQVDGFFYWNIKGAPHYGRFTQLERPSRLQHTWMSRSTHGEESTVTVTFEKLGENTRMTLVHSGLPDTEGGRGHDKGWNYFLDHYLKCFEGVAVEEK